MKRFHLVALVVLSACGTDTTSPSDLIPQSYAISKCGGFDAKSTVTAPAPGVPASYCDAELLTWKYDKASGKLLLSNTRANLNCCGDRTVKLEEKDGMYLVTEIDQPQAIETGSGPTRARCHCSCVFDLSVEAQMIPEGEIEVKLARELTDSGNPAQVLWSGKIDLAAGSGAVVLDNNPVMLDSSGVCMSQP